MHKVLPLLFCCLTFWTYGQNIGASQIDKSSISTWFENDISKYQGVYLFGEGDGSNLLLIITDTTIVAQIRQTLYWSEGGYAVESGIAILSEIGLKRPDFEITRWFPGKYPEASMQFLTSTDLETLTKEDLRKMRNEIFARYDYIFEKGSEMDNYFRQQIWHQNRYADVSGFLTILELTNIDTIKRLENNK
ncbi:MAG: YARHG domain-containing protein [Bacteroidia bacterium]